MKSGAPLDGAAFITATDQSKFATSFFKANVEVLRIDAEGRIFWRGREVESDDSFRAAMLDLAATLRGQRP